MTSNFIHLEKTIRIGKGFTSLGMETLVMPETKERVLLTIISKDSGIYLSLYSIETCKILQKVKHGIPICLMAKNKNNNDVIVVDRKCLISIYRFVKKKFKKVKKWELGRGSSAPRKLYNLSVLRTNGLVITSAFLEKVEIFTSYGSYNAKEYKYKKGVYDFPKFYFQMVHQFSKGVRSGLIYQLINEPGSVLIDKSYQRSFSFTKLVGNKLGPDIGTRLPVTGFSSFIEEYSKKEIALISCGELIVYFHDLSRNITINIIDVLYLCTFYLSNSRVLCSEGNGVVSVFNPMLYLREKKEFTGFSSSMKFGKGYIYRFNFVSFDGDRVLFSVRESYDEIKICSVGTEIVEDKKLILSREREISGLDIENNQSTNIWEIVK